MTLSWIMPSLATVLALLEAQKPERGLCPPAPSGLQALSRESVGRAHVSNAESCLLSMKLSSGPRASFLGGHRASSQAGGEKDVN